MVCVSGGNVFVLITDRQGSRHIEKKTTRSPFLTKKNNKQNASHLHTKQIIELTYFPYLLIALVM